MLVNSLDTAALTPVLPIMYDDKIGLTHDEMKFTLHLANAAPKTLPYRAVPKN